jgi:CheY-like chemotaxis protein
VGFPACPAVAGAPIPFAPNAGASALLTLTGTCPKSQLGRWLSATAPKLGSAALSDDERNLDQTPGAGSSRDLTGLHILLVEDSPDIGELVKTLLELEGTIVAGPATTAEEARKLVAERRPHVALVDFHLRDGNAYGLIARLRELGVPVIMISGSIEFPLPISLEGVTMLEKPFSETQLLACLRSLVAKITR